MILLKCYEFCSFLVTFNENDSIPTTKQLETLLKKNLYSREKVEKRIEKSEASKIKNPQTDDLTPKSHSPQNIPKPVKNGPKIDKIPPVLIRKNGLKRKADEHDLREKTKSHRFNIHSGVHSYYLRNKSKNIHDTGCSFASS